MIFRFAHAFVCTVNAYLKMCHLDIDLFAIHWDINTQYTELCAWTVARSFTHSLSRSCTFQRQWECARLWLSVNVRYFLLCAYVLFFSQIGMCFFLPLLVSVSLCLSRFSFGAQKQLCRVGFSKASSMYAQTYIYINSSRLFRARCEYLHGVVRELWPFSLGSLHLICSDLDSATLCRSFSLSAHTKKKLCACVLLVNVFGTVNTNHVNFGAFIMPFERITRDAHWIAPRTRHHRLTDG